MHCRSALASGQLAYIMGGEQSKVVTKWKDENLKVKQRTTQVFSSPAQEKYMSRCVPLHKAALKGDWKAAESLLIKDNTLVKARITETGETVLHIAAVEGHLSFVANLLENIEESEILEIQNKKGSTALSFAAAAGNVDIAKLMMEKNQKLPTIRGCDGVTPLFMAALLGHNHMAHYLFPLSDFEFWTREDQIELLTTSIQSGLYGLAMKILEQNKMLAVVEDINGESPLQVLARNPLAFCGPSADRLWSSIISRTTMLLLPYMKLKKNEILLSGAHDESSICDAYTLFGCLWDHVISCHEDNIETGELNPVGNTSKLLFVAAESGNDEFLVELISRYPDFLYKVNDSKHSIFHIAVLHRYVQTFNLIYELRGVKDLITTYIDTEGNNLMHLAARLAPQSQLNPIPGAALQMQREVLWYKEVEKMVQPSYRNMKNCKDQTPYDLFLLEHENLMKEGEKWMKQTAKSCLLVPMLIFTVVFTSAFTVPGGYDNRTGAPILLNDKLYLVFPVSEAVAILSSLTSMLMFLSILTSRYAENDFLESLPICLVIGVASLFVSIVAMMVAFCTCLLFYQHGLASITILFLFFACVPIMFVILKYPLLVTILRCSYCCRWLFGSNNRLFSS